MGELLIVFVVVLLVFGPNKLPQLGDALGKGIRSFKKASMEEDASPPGAPAAATGTSPRQQGSADSKKDRSG